MQHWELLIFFGIVALVYASVGFGGGSSYLAILALYALPFQEIRLTALLCNIIVVTGGTIIYLKRETMPSWQKIIPLVLFSVPAAFIGARLKIGEDVFFILLGCSLLVAAVFLWIRTKSKNVLSNAQGDGGRWVRDSFLGAAIGFLSGMVGIGGGIFLAPLLNLTTWDTPRRIAATASIFILVNSIAGIAGQVSRLPAGIHYDHILLLGAAVFIGGQIGSQMGAIKFNPLVIRRVTAVLVFVAGVEVLAKHLSAFK